MLFRFLESFSNQPMMLMLGVLGLGMMVEAFQFENVFEDEKLKCSSFVLKACPTK